MEAKNNNDFSDTTKDYTDSTGSRFRLNFEFTPREDLKVFFQPQFTKVWGQQELNLTSATPTASASDSSGALNDTGLDVHQAFMKYSAADGLDFTLGRSELIYGDELVIGAVGWSNVGRAFDLAMASWTCDHGKFDFFTANLVDANISTSGSGEKEFSGIYFTAKTSGMLTAADLYVLQLDDATTAPHSAVTSYGGRAKASHEGADLRIEVTAQNSQNNGSQFDAEAGYMVLPSSKVRAAVEYFQSSADYAQLFPTAHKWLGIADLFGRRNIKGYRAGLSGSPYADLTLKLDYHVFQRTDVNAQAYALNGTSGYGTIGDDSAIANEWDLVAIYKVNDQLNLEAGYAQASPDDYLKANSKNDSASFYYLQVATQF